MEGQKAHWVLPREDRVTAKGKGELTTFWLGGTGTGSASSATSSHVRGPAALPLHADSAMKPLPTIFRKQKKLKKENQEANEAASKTARLVDWNVDILQRLLKQIEARRISTMDETRVEDPAAKQLHFSVAETAPCDYASKNANAPKYEEPEEAPHGGGDIIYTDEVKEIITLPKFDSRVAQKAESPESIVLGYEVLEQLHDFVSTIASLYNDNPFHNFEHASHVTMSGMCALVSNVAFLSLDHCWLENERKTRFSLSDCQKHSNHLLFFISFVHYSRQATFPHCGPRYRLSR
jgi:hypothetical protein